MLRSILSGILIFVFSMGGWSQKLQFGPELGTNIFSVDRDTFGYKFVPALHVGGNVQYHFNEFWSLKSGIYFTQKTHYYSESDTTQLPLFGLEDQIDQVENLDLSVYSYTNSKSSQFYLGIPIMGSFHYKEFSVSLGTYANYMLFSRAKLEEITEVPVLQVIDVKSLDPSGDFTSFLPEAYTYSFSKKSNNKSLESWDFGLRGGFGVEVDRFEINAYYNFGLTSFRSEISKRYNYLQISLNYKFSLNRGG